MNRTTTVGLRPPAVLMILPRVSTVILASTRSVVPILHKDYKGVQNRVFDDCEHCLVKDVAIMYSTQQMVILRSSCELSPHTDPS